MSDTGNQPRPQGAMQRLSFGESALDSLLRLTALVAAAALSGFAGDWHWLLDLCAHFRWQYLVLLTPGIAAAMLRGRRWLAGILFGVWLLNAGSLWTATGPAPPMAAVDSSRPSLRLLIANVNFENRDLGALLALIKRESPDVIGILELSPQGARALSVLDRDYPFRHLESRADPFGIGLWSRLPDSRIEAVAMPPIELPALQLRWEDAGAAQLWLVHPFPPLGGEASRWRNEQLADLAGRVRGETAVIVAGDLNATPWSTAYRVLRRDTGLLDASAHGWPRPTWSGPNVLAALAIPIDHVLHGSDWVAHRHAVGPDIGSDHRPLLVELERVTAP